MPGRFNIRIDATGPWPSIRRAACRAFGLAFGTAFGLSLAACGPRVVPLGRSPAVGIVLAPLASERANAVDGVAKVELDAGSAVRLGPRLLLTAGHVVSAEQRAATEKELFLDEEPPPGDPRPIIRRRTRFEVVASGTVAPSPRDAQRIDLGDLDRARGDWILLRLLDATMPPPYAVIDWDAAPKEGERLFLVTPRGRYEKRSEVAGTVAVEARVLDILVLGAATGPRGVREPTPLPDGMFGLEIGDDMLQGCSGSMVARRGRGQPEADASAWPLVGIYFASSSERGRVWFGPLALRGPRVQIALRPPQELREAVERELARTPIEAQAP